MKTGTVALVIRPISLEVVEMLSDDREIALLETLMEQGGRSDVLDAIRELREQQKQEDEEFGQYIENLLSKPFVRPEIQQHAVQWLKSKLRIEEFQKSEREAASVIAQYAIDIYAKDNTKTDFFLSGPTAAVRVRVFLIETQEQAA